MKYNRRTTTLNEISGSLDTNTAGQVWYRPAWGWVTRYGAALRTVTATPRHPAAYYR